jgi:Ca2+-binding EF-hand superfamily protein
MKTIFLAGIATAAVLAAGAAFAQTAPAAQTPTARHARHNPFTTPELRTDVQKHVERMFARLDTNHDGFIAQDEVGAAEARFQARVQQQAPKRAARMFGRLDTNQDGQVTRAELEAARNARAAARAPAAAAPRAGAGGLFARADTNKDGVVTRAEFDAAAANAPRFRRAGFHGFGARMFGTADANKDGRVSPAEATQLALQHFDRADLNHDGTLTPDERRQARQLRRGPRHTG